MLLDWLLVIGGLAVLIGGGELLVHGASRIALLARVSPAVIGLTVVAAGTSMPELVVSVRGALEGSPGLAVGNIVGSNIFNIAAILGLAALVRPLRVRGSFVRLEFPVVLLSAMQLHLLARDHLVDRFEGAVLLAAMLAFTIYTVRAARTAPWPTVTVDPTAPLHVGTGRSAWIAGSAAVVVGVALLVGGAVMLVDGAAKIASALGVSQTVVGLTIVAAGTSTPELVTSIVATRRGQDDIAIANVLGSNVFNALGIAGITALIHPLPVPSEVVTRDNWWMLGASAILLPLMKTGMRINRIEGAILLLGYVAYVALRVA